MTVKDESNFDFERKLSRRKYSKKSIEEKLDDVDVMILEILHENARISMKDLGSQVSLTSPAVSERVKRLENSGVISAYRAIINPDALGKRIKAFINITVHTGDYSDFIKNADKDPRIVECHHITGEDSLLLKVVVNSMDELENVIESIKDIGVTKTSVVLSTPIQTKSYL